MLANINDTYLIHMSPDLNNVKNRLDFSRDIKDVEQKLVVVLVLVRSRNANKIEIEEPILYKPWHMSITEKTFRYKKKTKVYWTGLARLCY